MISTQAGNSLSLLGDAAAMSVDVFTVSIPFTCNIMFFIVAHTLHYLLLFAVLL